MKGYIKLNGVDLVGKHTEFSAGEVQVRVTKSLLREDVNSVCALITNSAELILLMQAGYVLKSINNHNILKLHYLPYSRYDRVERANDCLSIKVFCDMINSLNFNDVTVYDAHSDVTVALLNNCHNIPQESLVLHTLPNTFKYDAIISPDSGASKKAFKVAQKLGIPMIPCDKHRNFATGEIVNFYVPKDLLTKDIKNVLIVDDIADGGGTFIGLTKELKKYVDSVDLYVTHGIFSKGKETLLKEIDNIYSYFDWNELTK